jgi:5-methylcytosine-specific restriction endonuclease McrA
MNISREQKHSFYTSKVWRDLRAYKLSLSPCCQCPDCLDNDSITIADSVHHIVDIDINFDLRLDIDNLMSINSLCHSRLTVTNYHKQKQLEKLKNKNNNNKIINKLIKATQP